MCWGCAFLKWKIILFLIWKGFDSSHIFLLSKRSASWKYSLNQWCVGKPSVVYASPVHWCPSAYRWCHSLARAPQTSRVHHWFLTLLLLPPFILYPQIKCPLSLRGWHQSDVFALFHSQSCISENYILRFCVHAEPVHSGRDGADEPPTLIKEDLLSAGTVRRSPPDTQVNCLNLGSREMETLSLIQ